MVKKLPVTLPELFQDTNLYVKTRNGFNKAIAEAAIRQHSLLILDHLENDLKRIKVLDNVFLNKITLIVKSLPKGSEHSFFQTFLDHKSFSAKFVNTNNYYLENVFSSSNDQIYLSYIRKILGLNAFDKFYITIPVIKRLAKSKAILEQAEYDLIGDNLISSLNDHRNLTYYSTSGMAMGFLANKVSNNDTIINTVVSAVQESVKGNRNSYYTKQACSFASSFVKKLKDQKKKKDICRKMILIGHPDLTTAMLKTSPKMKQLMLMK